MPAPKNPIQMAVIGAAHGIKGEVRVKTFTGDPLALGDYGPFYTADGRAFEVADIRPANTVVVVRFKGVKDRDAAAREAYEEAGVVGRVSEKPAGRYSYWKRMSDHFTLCEVKLYLLEVEKQLDAFREQHQRDLHWFKLADAADIVDEPELSTALRKLEGRVSLAA